MFSAALPLNHSYALVDFFIRFYIEHLKFAAILWSFPSLLFSFDNIICQKNQCLFCIRFGEGIYQLNSL